MDGGISDVLVVGRTDDEALQAEVSTLGVGVRFVKNHHAERGQISSIVAAVDAVDHPGVQGLLVVPVDQPLIAAATVSMLLAAFAQAGPAVARATHQGRHGHPVVFAPSLFGELRRADPSQGARVVVRAHASEALELDVPDANVLIDIDDPEAYLRVFGVPLPS
jgi:molybdenum cofactor cytidylyltransferase